MGFIDKEGLKHIKEHKYVSGSSTYLETALQPFFNSCALLIPPKVAPNMVTLTGLLFNIIGCLTLLHHDSSMKKEVPPILQAGAAFCLFMYQQLDELDGKHARNTQ